MNKLMKKIVMGALTFTMLLGTVLSVSAAAIPTPSPKQDDGKAIVRKDLKIPEGVTINNPDSLNFDFHFIKVGIVKADGTVDTTLAGTMPGIDFVRLKADTLTPTGDPAVNGYLVSSGLTPDAIVKVLTPGFPHAGVYVYTVAEDKAGTTASHANGEVTYSNAVYQMVVYVENDVNLTTKIPVSPEVLKVTNVGFRQVQLDDGTPANTSDDITTDPDQIPIDNITDHNYFIKTAPIFTNEFNALVDLTVSKQVKGEYADTTQDFDYVLELTRPVSQAVQKETAAKEYLGYVIDTATGKAILDASSNPITVPVSFAPTDANTTVSFTLKHGQSVIFRGYVSATDPAKDIDNDITGLPAGTTYELTEEGVAGYLPSVEVFNNNATAQTLAAISTDRGKDFTIEKTTTPVNGNLILGTVKNESDWTNEYQTITATGILMNNLPFILLIVVAIGGFVGYIASKRRKASN